MPRFFVEQSDIHGSTAIIRGAEAHHLKAVLRLRPKDRISLFDGTGKIYQAEIVHISSDTAEAAILATEQAQINRPAVHLGQALLKGKKMDLIVQKATELGIASIYPYVSTYCTVSAPNENKADRWNRLALEACKQCGRAVPLACRPTTDFDTLLAAGGDYGTKLIFWEQETSQTLHHILPDTQIIESALFLIGPEGGFSREEVNKATAKGFQPARLGKLTLRAETASLAAMAILQYLLGNLNR